MFRYGCGSVLSVDGDTGVTAVSASASSWTFGTQRSEEGTLIWLGAYNDCDLPEVDAARILADGCDNGLDHTGR